MRGEFGAAGGALWRSFTDVLDLDPAELVHLRLACHTADEVSRLERQLAEMKPTVSGSTGQVRSNPLLAEVREHRLVLAKLLRAIKVPANLARADPGGKILSLRAQTAARARWSRRRS